MRLTLLLFLALLTIGSPALAVDDAKWKEAVQAYKEDFKRKSVRYKLRAIEALPLKDGRTIDYIIKKEKLLSDRDWWIRVTAAERLAKIKTPELRKKLLGFAKDRDERIREGIMTALALSHDRLDPPVIVEALDDRSWKVRRMACWAAGLQRVKEAVEPMIAMLHHVDLRTGKVVQEGETHPRVRSVLLFNLEEITGNTTIGTDPARWRQFWEVNKDKALPPVKRFDIGTFGDVKLEVNDTFARRGTGPLVIALPETHKICTYYMPYFNQWMFVKWVFINMPPITSFPDVQYDDDGDPIYPVDILVDAFEDLRKKRSVEKMILLGHGFTSWVAAKYAQKYPDRVMGLILLNPYATNQTFSKRIDEALRSGDPDAEFWGKVSRKQIKIGSRYESEVYNYYRNTAALGPKARDDIELGVLRKIWPDPNGTSITIPEFDIRGEETSRIPALVFFAKKDNELTGMDDKNRIRRYYPKHVIVPCGNDSARFPFMQDPERFEKGLRLFIDKKIER